MKRISQSILILLVALFIGLHWMVLQSVAWAGMFVDYAADHSLEVAIAKTFDSSNQCEICKIVEAGTQETAPEKLKTKKLDVFSGNNIVRVYPTEALSFAFSERVPELPRTYESTAPPPRRG
ncbi:MAG: hypothetical protein ACPGVU_19350 [Limisphaerales bacterium]